MTVMHHADRPYQAPRLAGVDQALGDGEAREPTDLLNQLRERLDNLAANHPSAHLDRSQPAEADEQPQGKEADEQPQGKAAELAEDSGSGETESWRRRDEPQGPRGPERREQTHVPEQGDAGALTEAFGDVPVGNGATLPPESALDGHYAQFDRARAHGLFPAQGEPYRPWFAADESGEPWFVE
jgi:hypothetical protein